MAEWIALRDVATSPRPGRAVALVAGATLDHAGFRQQAARWRAALAGQPAQCLALYFEDVAAFLPALYGAWHAGKTVCLCADTLPETIARLRGVVQGFAGEFPADCAPFAPLPDGVDDGSAWPALDEQATRLLVYTSGSTGEAVAIEKRLAQLAREVEALQATFGELARDAVVHGTVSHQHIYGLLFRALWPLAAGRMIAPRQFFHEQIAAAIDAPAVLVSSPAHLKRIPETVDWRAARAQLRAVFSSGGALPGDAAMAARERLGQAPIEIYGSSETGGIAWRRREAAEMAWQPLPGVAWRIGEDGLLELDSPHLAAPGWWCSADRVEADAIGGFRLLGRADRIVKVEERRVSLTALEQRLVAMQEVREARVLLVDGARAELAAVVVASPEGDACLRREGRRAFGQRLGLALSGSQEAVVRPRRWRFVPALPMNAQGKTTDAALHALFRPERPLPVWTQREQTQARLELDIDPALLVFDGHFPQAPILPGVAQLDWAIRFGRDAFPLPPRFLRMEALKFQRVVRPGARIQLHLEWLPQKSALSFRYESALGPHASGRAIFAGANA